MATKLEPLSIESLLQKQREEKEAAAKPKFLTKEERARIAIEKRAKEIHEQRGKEERVKAQRETLERQAEELRGTERNQFSEDKYTNKRNGNRYEDRNVKGRERDRKQDPQSRPAFENGIPTGPRADRKGSGTTSNNSPAPPFAPPPPLPSDSNGFRSKPDVESNTPFVPPITDQDLSAIRSRYLGVDKKKRKIRKMNDRKFVFDWDEQEDTFTPEAAGPVASMGQNTGVMFGRGHLAGMDDGDGIVRRSNVNANLADAMERRKAAKAGVDERHWSDKPLSDMKERDWRIFREDFNIAARGGQIPFPLRSWRESTIPPELLDIIDQVGYKEPSAIQRQAIPIGLQNRDVIGIAETGSGKTAAFVIPMLAYISTLPSFTDENRHLGPYALILAPTRELAQQIESETKKFASPLGFTSVSIVGGRAMEEQQFNLREGAHIVIATPGRLKDVIDRHVLVLSQCTYVVMDEADRMVHLGFEADLNFILDALPSDVLKGEEVSDRMDIDEEDLSKRARTRVTTLFSATMPPAVERLARKYLRRPATITIGEAGRAVDTVDQRVEFVNSDEKKKQRILEILNNDGYPSPIIVFVNQKKTADMVAKDLSRAGWSTSTLHSGKNQEQREAALAALRKGDADILVATDLAGRGIDVQDVSLVINFQMANTIEAYVHRIGRTGRAGKQGTAITFLTNDDEEVMYDLKQEIGKSPVSKVPMELARHEAAQQKVSREMKRKRDAEDQGHLRALPNVDFVHGYPGISASSERPQASIRGFLEVRVGSQPVKAKWVKVEFRKIETIPSGKTTEEFIDHIGPGPITLWESQNERDLLASGDFPFNIRIPETIPPSVALEKGWGIKYELCTTMCLVKGKKGFFRREGKMMVTSSVPIVIDKHELHSTWPIYGQPDSRQVAREDGLILMVDRGNTCFAPGDPLAVIVTVKSENLRPVVVRSLELSLEEAITFHGAAQALNKRSTANVNKLNILGEHKLPLSYTLYGGTQQRVELAVNVPPNHTTTSVTTGRHIDIAYKIRVRCFLDNAGTLELEVPLTMTNWSRLVSAELTRRIGVAPNLTSRAQPASRSVQGPLSPQDTSANIQSPIPPVPPKPTTSKSTAPVVNGSNSTLPSTVPAPTRSQTHLLSPTITLPSENRNQPVNSPGSSHEGTTSESAVVQGITDEFGYRQGDIPAATAPARIGQRPASVSESDDRKSERFGAEGSLSGGGSLNRRARNAEASRFKVVNPDNNIPEEPALNAPKSNSPVKINRWPTAEEEKYEAAKARVAQVQNTVFEVTSPHANGHISQPINGSYEKLRPSSPPKANTSAWVSAENEKKRLYDEALAKVRETQGQAAVMGAPVPDSPLPPPSNPQTRSEFRRPHPDSFAQGQPTPRSTRSAGAALYSRAIEQINRSSTIPAPQPPPQVSENRRNISFTASARPVVEEKGAMLYYQAKQNVHRHLQEQGEVVVQEDGPIPYDQLFGGNAIASSSNHGHTSTPGLSEKELLRRHHEQQDAMAIPAQDNSHPPQALPQQVNRTSSVRSPTSGIPSSPLSEKERMRRAFEARDAALRAAGQSPPPMLPGYDTGVLSNTNGTAQQPPPLSAAEEKNMLAQRYGVNNDGDFNHSSSPVPPPPPMISEPTEPTESLNVISLSPTRQRSVRSEVSGNETFLRRDPSVSAGKRRQMNIGRESPPPPPLPPRPPSEYIEETRREDHRTTLRNALPLDFSTSFDLGFETFGSESHS